jgi:hypothetical protein
MADKIYVVLHGLISLAEEVSNNQFRAFLIDMPDHRVAAGHWLTEKTIPKGALLQLTGVVTGSPAAAPFDRSKNIVFPRTTSPTDPSPINQAARNKYRYAEIILPWPTTINSLNPKNIVGDLVGSTETGAKTLSEVQVFEYDVVSGTRPSLVGDTSTPWNGFLFFTALTGPSNTIHILNEPEAGTDGGHVIEEFRRSAEIFKSVAHLNTGITPASNNGVPPALRPALLHEELLPLAQRQHRAVEMADKARPLTPVPFVTASGGIVGGNLVCSGGHGSGN